MSHRPNTPRRAKPLAHPLVSKFAHVPTFCGYRRIGGHDPSLPDVLRVTQPRLPHIAAPVVLTNESGKVLSGLRHLERQIYRGDLLRPDGERELLIVRATRPTDAEGVVLVVARFPKLSPKTTAAQVLRLASTLCQ